MATRAYTQTARAEATAQTRQAVIDAAIAVFEDGQFDVPLDSIAHRAKTTTRTILRHFGSRDGLMRAASAQAEARILRSRVAPPGDAPAAIRVLVDHYEEMGDRVVRRLAEEHRHPALRGITERGKDLHRRWVEETFAPDLEPLAPGPRRRRIAALATVTDVYTWSLLRRRYRLSRRATEEVLLGLVQQARKEIA